MWDDTGAFGMVAHFNHVPGGANVLYMDGHVEFLKWHSQFPADVMQLYISCIQE